MPTPHLLLFDTASLYFRAFHGLPQSFRNPAGQPCNAVRGLADFVARVIAASSATHAVACWDTDWRPGWRVALLASYKRHRAADPATDVPVLPVGAIGPVDVDLLEGGDAPDDLAVQLPAMVEMLDAAGIPVWGAESCEADDVIATLASRWPGTTDVVTGDRDLWQLVDDRCRVRWVARGVSAHELITPAEVQDRYGVSPENYVALAVLRGDASDGLPGVKGVGEKTAASLMEKFGSLPNIVDAAHGGAAGMTPRVAAAVAGACEYIAAATRVVTVLRDIPFSRDFEEARLTPIADVDAWLATGERLGLGGAGDRLRKALDVDTSSPSGG